MAVAARVNPKDFFEPQEWAPLAAPYPVVAIGGISLERLPGVLACGVDGVAVVSAVTLAADPQQAALQGLSVAVLHAGRVGLRC